jgi:hypothetical protein
MACNAVLVRKRLLMERGAGTQPPWATALYRAGRIALGGLAVVIGLR